MVAPAVILFFFSPSLQYRGTVMYVSSIRVPLVIIYQLTAAGQVWQVPDAGHMAV